MCTSGVISAGRDQTLGFKTLDGGPATVWHGFIHRKGGLRALGAGTTGRPGVNSGLNEAGAGIILSYLDTCEPRPTAAESPTTWVDDKRWIANGDALAQCKSAVELADFLTDYFRTNRSMGGNHLLFDQDGTILGLEHQAGDVEVADYTADGWTARGNDNCILPDTVFASLSPTIHQDRRVRREVAGSAAREALQRLRDHDLETAESLIQGGLSQHVDGGVGVGSVCAHGVDAPGGRSPSAEPYYTTTGLIFNAEHRSMIFSNGNPCEGDWHRLSMPR